MISKVHFRKDFAAKYLGKPVRGRAWSIPFFAQNDSVALHSRLTVLFGPNGSGKSTLLELIAVPTCCISGGLYNSYCPSDINPFVDSKEFDQAKTLPYLERLYNYYSKAMHLGRVEVEWDGLPVYYRDFQDATATRAMHTNEDMVQTLANLWHSSGEGIQRQISLVIGGLEQWTAINPQTVRKSIVDAPLNGNEAWQESKKAWKEYILYQSWSSGRVTVLLDEPDLNFSIPAQHAFWQRIEKLSERLQLVIASHSPFALAVSGQVIEMAPGYVVGCRQALEELSIKLKSGG